MDPDRSRQAPVIALTMIGAAAAGLRPPPVRKLQRLCSELRPATTTVSATATDPMRGAALIETAFMLESGTTLLNHGSYGTLPRMVAQKQQQLVAQIEANPDTWFRREYPKQWRAATDAVADLAGAERGDVVFVKNATAGVNAVVNTLKLSPLDSCLITSQTYGACANAVANVCERSGATLITLQIERNHLTDEDELAALFEEQLVAAPQIVFALIDHITSPTAVLLPIARLCALCRKHGVRVMVDGAHAPGNVVPLHVPSFGADWYTGNLHKWVFCPKGAAFLWVPKYLQPDAQALIISHSWKGTFQARFEMQGEFLIDTSLVPQLYGVAERLH